MLESSPASPDRLQFPYMRFARSDALRARFPLTISGMPPADTALFADLAGPDLAFAGKSALPRLQELIAAHVGTTPERVIVTLGASSAMHVLARAFFAPGVRVASETPAYEPLHVLPRVCGAELAKVERSSDAGWALDSAQFERALAGARRGHVFVTNPHNPTGALDGAAAMVELARIAERAGGILISNEIYMEYVPPERRVRAHALAPNVASIGSLTKAYGLGPLRVGWIVLGDALASERQRLEEAIFLDYVDPPTSTLAWAVRAFERLPELAAPIQRVMRESRPVFASWLSQCDSLCGSVPEFGLISFLETPGIHDTRALARHLLTEHDVGVVPGEFFDHPGYVRVSFGLPPDRLREALERLKRGLDSFGRSR